MVRLASSWIALAARRVGRLAERVAIALPMLALPSGRAAAQTGPAAPNAALVFHIAAQPLQSALDAYAAATGLEVLYDSRLARGRRSTGVAGALTPAAALTSLLAGTGLIAVYAGADAFAVVLRPATGDVPPAVNPERFRRYFAIVQAGIEAAFCARAATMPGGYRLALRFWIGPGGAVQRPELLGSTNDPTRDAAIARTLAGVTFNRAPPAGMPQPIVMLITPRPPQQTGDCGGDPATEP